MSDVSTDTIGAIGRIRLERPAALNALDLPMFQAIERALLAWRDDPRIGAVITRGTGKAFSAGGDIRAVRDAVLRDDWTYTETLYRSEYGINALISAYPKPYVALIDGYCLGGGMGLAVHGSHRVVSESAVLAMPETAIGFFPDIGCTYLLPRLPGNVGFYLGLTGYRMNAADAIACGVADALVSREHFDAVEAAIAEDPAQIDAVLGRYAQPSDAAPLAPYRAQIERCFGAASVRGVVAALERDGSAWAQETLAVLRRMSPHALAVSFAMFKRSATMTLEESLDMELRVGRIMCRSADFLEGVRAMVIDKDRTPAWSDAAIEAVDEDAVRRMIEDALRSDR